MNISELVTSLRGQVESLKQERETGMAEVRSLLSSVEAQGRKALSADEDTRLSSLFAKRDDRDAKLRDLTGRLETAERALAEDEALAASSKVVRDTAAVRSSYDGVARVGVEERTYRPDFDKRGKQFLRDVGQQFLYGSLDASQRLARHMQEERVERPGYQERTGSGTGTGNFAGLTVPQYLTDLYAPATAGLRPFADSGCVKHDLPAQGMTINISRITTPTSTALQSSENTAVSWANDIDDTLLTENIQTIAGQQTLSRQALERSTGVEEVAMNDLFRRYATTLDSTLITQATTGLSAVAQATTYTDATPTAIELYPKILGAVSNLEIALLAQAQVTHVTMHSRRWHWLSSQLTSQWPFINQPGIAGSGDLGSGVNAGGVYNSGVRGILPNGLRVIVDNNLATNLGGGTEDEIYVTAYDECHLWEDSSAPMFIRAEQPAVASLGVLYVLYGYVAYTFRRYTNGASKVSGSGLAAPTF